MSFPSFAPRTKPPSGGSPLPFCERCGNLVGAVSNLIGVRLESCQACGVFACDRCWAGAAGSCPGCGRKTAVAGAGAAAGTNGRLGRPAQKDPARSASSGTRRPGPRLAIAAGAVAFALSVVVLVNGNPFAPAGGVEGAIGTPSPVGSALGAADDPPSPSETPLTAVVPGEESAAAGSAPPPTVPAATPADGVRPAGEIAETPRPPSTQGPGPAPTGRPPSHTANPPATPKPTAGSTANPTPPPTAAPTPTLPFLPTPTPVPTPTPAPTPTPTPAPTPMPTPAPTPTAAPTPTPGCSIVPLLIGETLSHARADWTAAGFTGSFTPSVGQNNKLVLTQSEPPGLCLPASTSITVTHN